MLRKLTTTIMVVLAFLSLAGLVGAQYALTTPIDHDNQQNGIMFDVKATGTHARITEMDLILEYGSHNVEVWRVTGGGSWIGNETDPTAWTLVGTTNVFSTSEYTFVPLGLSLDIPLQFNQPLGLYVTSTGAASWMPYTNGSNMGGVRSSMPFLEIYEGVGKSYPFGATYGSTTPGNSSRMFNGRIHFSLGVLGDPDTLTTGPSNATTNGMSFDILAKEYVTVEGLSLDLNPGNYDLEVWTPRLGGNAVPALGSPGDWMLAGQVLNFPVPAPGVYNVGFDLDVPIVANERRGFYVNVGAAGGFALRVDTGPTTVGETTALDESIEIESGNAHGYFLTGPGSEIGFCGAVHYRRTVTGDFTGTTSTLLATGDGPNSGAGLFFDLAGINDFVQVYRLDAIMHAGTHTVQLWVVKDRTTHQGKWTNSSLWNRVAQTTVTVGSGNTLTNLFNDLRIVLEPGMVQGCYLTVTTGAPVFSYSFAPQGVPYASNSVIEVRGGVRADVPWTPLIPDRGPDLQVGTRHSTYSVDSVAQDFSSGSGILPPTGWLTHLSDGDNIDEDGWRFDNPQPISPPAMNPIDSDFAVVDTDYSGSLNPVDATLYTPRFYGTNGDILLTFDHYHRPLNSTISIEIWDGVAWNNVYGNTGGTVNPAHEVIDITAAAGNYSEARARFRYVGNYDWHWAVDNVRIRNVGAGQAPRPGLSVMDVNYARETNNLGVASNLPGPYFSAGYTSVPVVFEFEGEPNQPILLMQGASNVAGWDFGSYGKLDIGFYNPGNGSFSLIEQLAYGGDPGFINSLFLTNPTGALQLAFPLPVFTAGNLYHFQSLILSSHVNSALSNMVRLFVVN